MFLANGKPHASIVLGARSKEMQPRSWVARESSAREARTKILVHIYIYISIFGVQFPGSRARNPESPAGLAATKTIFEVVQFQGLFLFLSKTPWVDVHILF